MYLSYNNGEKDHCNVFFSERLRSGALLLTLSKKFSGGLRPPDPPIYYIEFTEQYDALENLFVGIFEISYRFCQIT